MYDKEIWVEFSEDADFDYMERIFPEETFRKLWLIDMEPIDCGKLI